MEDERHDLLSTPGSVGQQERNSCGRGTAYTAFSILVALLLAGQAVTGYFIYQQQTQISKIRKTTQELKLKSLAESLPQNPKSGNQMRMSVARVMPMMMMEPSNNGEDEMKLTNSTQDQVKRVLMKENPLRKFPTLNNTFMENIGNLKARMEYEDWKAFEVWMHKWLLFQMAQNEAPDQKVKTKCQEEECNKGVHPGKFCPQCDEKGEYLPMQCFHSTGYCWCVYKNGTVIEGTEVRGRPDCTGENLKDMTTPPSLH